MRVSSSNNPGQSASDVFRQLLSLTPVPEIVQCGLATHGHEARSAFVQRELFSLHFYQYQGSLSVAQQPLDFNVGSISLIPPSLKVEWRFPPNASHYYLHFRIPLESTFPSSPVVVDPPGCQETLIRSFEDMIHQFPVWPMAANVRLWDIIWQVFIRLQQVEGESEPSSPVQIAVSQIRNQLDGRLRVSELAKGAGVSPGHLCRLFQKAYGESVQVYISRIRLERALELLDSSGLSVASIAQGVGIPDLHAFNKFFRKRTGVSPRSYRVLRDSGRSFDSRAAALEEG